MEIHSDRLGPTVGFFCLFFSINAQAFSFAQTYPRWCRVSHICTIHSLWIKPNWIHHLMFIKRSTVLSIIFFFGYRKMCVCIFVCSVYIMPYILQQMHVQTCANFQFYQHMNTWRQRKTKNETEKESSAVWFKKKFYGKWKIEAIASRWSIPNKVVVVNDISCAVGIFFFFISILSVWACHAMCVPISLDFTGVVFNYVWKFIFQWAYRTHVDCHWLCIPVKVCGH